MLRPFASEEGGPIGGGGQSFAVGGAEQELQREAAFANGGMLGEGEAILELHLGFGRVVDVAELDRAAAGPGEGEGHQFIQPSALPFFQVLLEPVQERRGLGFFDEGDPLESPSEAGGDGDFVEGGELKLGQRSVDEVHASDELLQPMIHERQLEGSCAVGLGEAASAGDGIEVALLRFLLDHEIAITRDLHGGDALVLRIKEMLDGGAQMLGKHLGNPLGLHGGGEAEQSLTRWSLAKVGGDEIGGVGHHAFADELALALIGEIAGELAGLTSFGELIDEAGHEATQQGFVVRGSANSGIAVVEALLVGGVQNLLAGLLHLAGDLGVDTVAAAAIKAEAVRFGEVVGSHQRDEVGVRALLEHLTRGLGLGIITIQAGEQIATTDQGGAQGGIGHTAALAGLDQHS